MTQKEALEILDSIPPGGTPVLRLPEFKAFPEVRLWAKLEGCNPSGSSKDRPAHAILRAAWESGEVHADTVLLESTSGNMAIALAQYARRLGLDLYCITDDRSLPQNRRIMDLFQIKRRVVEAGGRNDPVQMRLEILDKLRADHPGKYFWTRQYTSPLNPASYDAMVSELERQLDSFDLVFVPVSTGGSAAGIRKSLLARGIGARVIMVDAQGSAATHLQVPAKRYVAGFGSSRASDFLSAKDADHVMFTTDLEAICACHELMHRGTLLGGSSGAIVAACHRYLQGCGPRPRNVVLFCPDRGDRYLDNLYANQWLRERGFNLEGCPQLF